MRHIEQEKIIAITLIIGFISVLFFGFYYISNEPNQNDTIDTNSDKIIDNSTNNNTVEYAEQFTFQLLDGTTKNMKDYQGKVVLLDFMGANCQPCQMQLKELYELYQDYSKNEFEIISIDVWVITGETAQTMNSLLDAFKEQLNMDLNWTFGLDDKEGTLYFKYADVGVPQMYILDKNGNIKHDLQGYKDYSFLVEKLNEML